MVNPIPRQTLDPICGTWLAPDQIKASYTYLGQTYYFCCDACRDAFRHAPERTISVLAHQLQPVTTTSRPMSSAA